MTNSSKVILCEDCVKQKAKWVKGGKILIRLCFWCKDAVILGNILWKRASFNWKYCRNICVINIFS